MFRRVAAFDEFNMRDNDLICKWTKLLYYKDEKINRYVITVRYQLKSIKCTIINNNAIAHINHNVKHVNYSAIMTD